MDLKTTFFPTWALAPMLRTAATTHTAKVINIAAIGGISDTPNETYSYAAT